MSISLDDLLANVPPERPIMDWNPAFSGEMDMRIDGQGNWIHEGQKIEREGLVRLFASILRKEDDGYYYLVTPVEKWRIQVEDAPFMVIAVDVVQDNGRAIALTTNMGDCCVLDEATPLVCSSSSDETAAVKLYVTVRHGLRALFNRNAYYQLVALAEEKTLAGVTQVGVQSNGQWFPLGEA